MESLKELIQEELKDIPENKLREVYDLIHYFRVGINEERIEEMKLLRTASEKKFAQIWSKEKDNVWESYL